MSARSAGAELRDRRRLALAVSLLLNFAFLLALHFETAPHARVDAWRAERALQVRLIEPQPVLPAPVAPDSAPPPPTSATPPAQRHVPAPVRAQPPAARTETPPSPPLNLFGLDGRILIPQIDSNDSRFPTQATTSDTLARRNTLPYAATYFEGAWVPRDETLGGEVVRRTTSTHRWLTPWGTQIVCSATWLLAFGGCGWGFVPTAPIEELQRIRADPPIPHNAPAKVLLAK